MWWNDREIGLYPDPFPLPSNCMEQLTIPRNFPGKLTHSFAGLHLFSRAQHHCLREDALIWDLVAMCQVPTLLFSSRFLPPHITSFRWGQCPWVHCDAKGCIIATRAFWASFHQYYCTLWIHYAPAHLFLEHVTVLSSSFQRAGAGSWAAQL